MRVHRLRWVVLVAAAAGAAGMIGCRGTKATALSGTPPSATRAERAANSGATPGAVVQTGRAVEGGVPWRAVSLEKALQMAKQEHKPVLMDVMASWCHFCKKMDEDVWSRSDVGDVAKDFVPIQVDGDKNPDVVRKYSATAYPTTLFLSADGRELIPRLRGAVPYEDMLAAMQDALKKAKGA